MVLMAAFVSVVFVYSLVSRRLARTIVTAPIVFTAAGALTWLLPPTLSELALDRKAVLLIAEVGLVMTLFTDASRINPQMLKGNRNLPVRLLSIGMLPTILLGAVCAMVVLGGLSWWEAGILAAILAPTDAGLGQVIVTSRRVPVRIRQALNVEAGLNDGMSVPFLMFFIALAEAREGIASPGVVLTRFLGEQLGYGIVLGLGFGLVGGWLLGLGHRGSGWPHRSPSSAWWRCRSSVWSRPRPPAQACSSPHSLPGCAVQAGLQGWAGKASSSPRIGGSSSTSSSSSSLDCSWRGPGRSSPPPWRSMPSSA